MITQFFLKLIRLTVLRSNVGKATFLQFFHLFKDRVQLLLT